MVELFRRAAAHGARIAFRSPAGETSYATLLARSASIAQALLAGRADLAEERIAFMLPAGADYALAQWGIWRAGGIAHDFNNILVAILGFSGLGKTVLVKALARALTLRSTRIQFTPDLLPGDITGSYVYDRAQGQFELRKGPIFANIILADEINRASPKTQSALLEAMQERQVTLEGETMELPEPCLLYTSPSPRD